MSLRLQIRHTTWFFFFFFNSPGKWLMVYKCKLHYRWVCQYFYRVQTAVMKHQLAELKWNREAEFCFEKWKIQLFEYTQCFPHHFFQFGHLPVPTETLPSRKRPVWLCNTKRKVLTGLFCIHKLTNHPAYLVSLWLTAKRLTPSTIPTTQTGQVLSLALLAMDRILRICLWKSQSLCMKH